VVFSTKAAYKASFPATFVFDHWIPFGIPAKLPQTAETNKILKEIPIITAAFIRKGIIRHKLYIVKIGLCSPTFKGHTDWHPSSLHYAGAGGRQH